MSPHTAGSPNEPAHSSAAIITHAIRAHGQANHAPKAQQHGRFIGALRCGLRDALRSSWFDVPDGMSNIWIAPEQYPYVIAELIDGAGARLSWTMSGVGYG